ncbi:hypothetical protein P691DRAFT_777585 [Macrolepiota fuliginosa MF-IS2]|uniref:CENP-V/GFA domain-containing protein n=1 Tax=Macrolepiota fuliginosa MF-IS2 TaxID=1400762 RepID=A0A9P5X6I5_9AGAR|nr:hypothetical protein P691DRAFT_777585 [Macrolepiota fuliginosa MF-IS2]
MPHSGSCLCGQTKIEIGGESAKAQIICHCIDCRQAGGSAFSGNIVVSQKDVEITGPVKEYTSLADSGNPITRIFCGNCGCPVSHKSAWFGENQVMQTGNFSEFANVPIAAEVYVKDRWTGLGPVAGAAQWPGMPEKSILG